MFELLYTSVSPAGLDESELEEILAVARKNNHALGVTGMMVYHEREIMQILEGEERAVKDLFAKISHDERHTSVNVFYQGPIDERAFHRWEMAFKALDGELIEEVRAGSCSDGDESLTHLAARAPNQGKQIFMSLRHML